MNHRYPNYRLRDGDKVVLKIPLRVSGYVYDEAYAPYGMRDSHYMLKGCVGTVVHARTPCVTGGPKDPIYFANVDIPHNGVVSRVRPFHHEIRRMSA